MPPPAHQHGRLCLELESDQGRTVIVRQRSTPPLQIFGLQHDAEGAAYLQIVNPSGGLCEGDTLHVDITVHTGAHLYLTTTAATKIYPAEHGEVTRQQIRLYVASGAILEYMPLPLMPFAQAMYVQETTMHIEPGGVCMVAEVLAPGRMARGERLDYRLVRSRVEGWMGEQLALSEQMRLEPLRYSPDGLGLLDGRSHLATLYVLASPSFAAWIPAWNRRLTEQFDASVGITELVQGGLVARLLADTAQQICRRLEVVHTVIRAEALGLTPLAVYRPWA
jgi:urease accessory protein